MYKRQALCLWTSFAFAASDPQVVVDEFLHANRADDVETMVMLATPHHEPTIRSARWRDFWKGFVISEYLGVRYATADGRSQKAEVLVMLEYSDTIMQRVYRQYDALPPGPDRAIYQKTIERKGRREAAIAVIRIGNTWYWNHD